MPDYVLLGGKWSSGNNWYLLKITDGQYHKISIPIELFYPGKAIDDFIVLENKIIAVDNIVMPKYLIEYERKFLPRLDSAKIFKLEPNGTYESIQKAVSNEHYIGLLSGTTGG